ncbi:hypothetical protein [Aerobium aerolatum]|uniref:Uncharacterized protein n=1 Tax=Aquamicrobium aerolatum DSM 21857 TaxID=1121003 RepID=A0A1I3T801_9HYPH|nr:hypothetical protein [Aquamicrobium aerolatum]SFJ65627.1 hypothetical protein SAMN03080618_03567 [Aquamicrobium aerolatum DSM 21857]
MAGNLATRLEKLEAIAGARTPTVKLVRMCVSDDDIAEAHREATERGLTDDEVQIIHLVPLQPL